LGSTPGVDPLPTEEPGSHAWSTYRRPALLVGLLAGLALFLVWLPSVPRAALVTALHTQRVLMSMLFLFALLVLSLVWSAGQRLDTWVFLVINLRGYHPRWLDRAIWLITQLGNMVTAILIAILFLLLNYRSLTVEIIFGSLLLWLLVETIKLLSDRARPFLTLEGTRVIGWRERGRSFPSGHTSQIFFLATLISHQFHPGVWVTIVLYAVAILVGFSRMYVGAHYPRDVIGGAVLGSIWGVLITLVDPYWLGIRF
jgi:membrane-associated phospholipid phosphatase